MKKINFRKIGLGLVVVFVAIGLIVYFIKNRNQETIVDLGDGWKSYSHKEIGFTVKIPVDAEIKFEVKGDKKDSPWSSFSKGPISSISAWTSFVINADRGNQIDKYLKIFGINKEAEKYWDVSKNGNRNRTIFREIIIKDKRVLVEFDEFENKEKNALRFQTESITAIGNTRVNEVFLNPDNFTITAEITKEHPHFTKDEIEEFIQKHIDLIDEYIIAIEEL